LPGQDNRELIGAQAWISLPSTMLAAIRGAGH